MLDDGLLIGTEVISTLDREPRHVRLGRLSGSTLVLLGRYRPHIVAIETSAGWQKLTHDSRVSVEALAQARAAVLIAVYRALEWHGLEIRLIEMDSNDVREMLCANRRAGKEQVAENLMQRGFILPVRLNGIVDYDVSDAVGLAVAVHCQERLLALKEG